MVEAVAHCHSLNIIHRDIKLANFLIDVNENEETLIKLTDFGLSCKYDLNKPLTKKCGTLISISPEMIKRE